MVALARSSLQAVAFSLISGLLYGLLSGCTRDELSRFGTVVAVVSLGFAFFDLMWAAVFKRKIHSVALVASCLLVLLFLSRIILGSA